jgi:hypothetical protein
MKVRVGTIAIILLLSAGAGLLASWVKRTAPLRKQRERAFREQPFRGWPGPSPMMGLMGPGMMGPGMMAPGMVPGFGPMGPFFSREPRLLVTLSTQAGPFTVTVRHIRAEDGLRTINMPFDGNTDSVGRFLISIQLLSRDPQAVRQSRLLRGSLRAIDNTGKILRAFPPERESMERNELTNGGVRYSYVMEAPAPSAQYLTRLEGEIQILDSYSRIPFRLTNIPLPNCPRLFGQAAPRVLSAKAAAGLPSQMIVVSGPKVDALSRESTPAPEASFFPPQQLLMPDKLPVSMGVPTPEGPVWLQLTSRLGPMGSIHISLRIAQSEYSPKMMEEENWKGRIWEGDTLFIVLPARKNEPRKAVALRIHRDILPPIATINDAPPPLFPASRGMPGGAITTGVIVGNQPFGPGSMKIRLWQRVGNRWSEPQDTFVVLSNNGEFILANLQPGEYRMERILDTLTPLLPRGEKLDSLERYLQFRYGLRNGAWEGQIVEHIIVRGGQTTKVPPLRYTLLKT